MLLATDDGTASVWDAAAGRAMWDLKGHTGDIVSVSFSHDGRKVLSSSYDRTARVWDAATGRELRVLAGHSSWVWRAVFSPDDTRIATASYDGTARVWDAVSGQEITTFRGHKRIAFRAVFSPDGRKVFSKGEGRPSVRVWDATTGQELARLDERCYVGTSIAFSPDGRQIVTTRGVNAAHVFDAETGREIAELTVRGAESYEWGSFLPDGKRVLVVSDDRPAPGGLNPPKPCYLVLLDAEGNRVNAAAIAPDGRQIVAGGPSRTARLYDAATGRALAVLCVYPPVPPELRALEKDGVFFGSLGSPGTRIWDSASGKEIALLKGMEHGALTVSFSKDGQRMATVSADGKVTIWKRP